MSLSLPACFMLIAVVILRLSRPSLQARLQGLRLLPSSLSQFQSDTAKHEFLQDQCITLIPLCSAIAEFITGIILLTVLYPSDCKASNDRYNSPDSSVAYVLFCSACMWLLMSCAFHYDHVRVHRVWRVHQEKANAVREQANADREERQEQTRLLTEQRKQDQNSRREEAIKKMKAGRASRKREQSERSRLLKEQIALQIEQAIEQAKLIRVQQIV